MTETRETEIVAGTVDSIVEKGASKWQVIVKTHDSAKYGKKLWTKSADQIALTRTLLGQTATFECGVSHYQNTETGAPVSSLWINAVNPGAPPPQGQAIGVPGPSTNPVSEATGATQTASQPPQAAAPAPKRTDDPRQDSIERQTALKAAVEFYGVRDASAELVLATAERFVDFLKGKKSAASEEPPPLPYDDDLPF